MDELQSLFASERESTSAQRPDSEPPSDVVGIATSAGQLGMLEWLFDAMPVDAGMAFVIIQQSSVNATHVTREMLSWHTEMPIHREVDALAVERNSVYLIPPHKEMIIAGGRLLLIKSDSSEELPLFVDTFFRSLAEDLGERAIGIVPSGTLRDGSHGERAGGEAGGMVIARGETAKSDAMPWPPSKSVSTTCFCHLLTSPSHC